MHKELGPQDFLLPLERKWLVFSYPPLIMRVVGQKAAIAYIDRNSFQQFKVSDLISTVTLWHLEDLLCKEPACPLLPGRVFEVCTAPTSVLHAARARTWPMFWSVKTVLIIILGDF